MYPSPSSPWPGGPQPAPVPPRPPSPWQPVPVVIAVVATVVLVGSLVVALAVGDDDELALTPAGPTTTEPDDTFDPADPRPADWVTDPDPDLELPDEWDERVVDLVEFVEDERGLEFVSPVPVEFLTEDEFRDELSDDHDDPVDEEALEEAEELQEQLPMFRALGWLEGDIDMEDEVEDYLGAVTAAFYDTEERRVVVPTTDPSPHDEMALVHELTHALQDQYFDLESLWPEDDEEPESGDDEGETGDDGRDGEVAEDAEPEDGGPDPWVTPIVEGDASRIEQAWLYDQSSSVQDEIITENTTLVEEAEDDTEDSPSFLTASFYTSYLLGQPLVTLLAEEGGNERVNAAFMDLPTTGSQLTDPRTYLEGHRFDELDPPEVPSGTEEIDSGEFDAWDVAMLLAERGTVVGALEAADGWQAGSYVAYENEERLVCVRFRVTGGTDEESDLLADALDEWVGESPDEARAEVDDSAERAEEGVVEVRTCDPGDDVDLSRDRLDFTLDALAFRAGITAELVALMSSDVDEAWEAASCATAGILDNSDVSFDDAYSPDPPLAMVGILMDCGVA